MLHPAFRPDLVNRGFGVLRQVSVFSVVKVKNSLNLIRVVENP
jgi:hypothetical protein